MRVSTSALIHWSFLCVLGHRTPSYRSVDPRSGHRPHAPWPSTGIPRPVLPLCFGAAPTNWYTSLGLEIDRAASYLTLVHCRTCWDFARVATALPTLARARRQPWRLSGTFAGAAAICRKPLRVSSRPHADTDRLGMFPHKGWDGRTSEYKNFEAGCWGSR